jgi:hypothetical protein
MTPKEKAGQLALKYNNLWINGNSIMAKECALIADIQNFWKEVKQEIEKL